MTVVVIVAVETEPTNKSQRSSHLNTVEEANAVGLATVVVPLNNIEPVGVGIMETDVEVFVKIFWDSATPACINIKLEGFIMNDYEQI